ncbi:MAG TPA: ABC transporter ATP-binding protein [Acidimicrobiales bacterium]|nr:ABC transporter ATP-binding protein [Acidimicrobiales bacterium]
MSDRLRVEELSAGYAEPVVRGVSFSSAPGEIVAIVGANGAGKSTILKTIMGEARAHSGRILYEEEEVTGRHADYLSRLGVGYVPQLHDVFPGLSVMENLKMGGYLLSRALLGQRIEASLERFPQLRAKRGTSAHKLSGGERKQLALARALMTEPSLILLDEPTSNLSPNIADDLLYRYVPSLAQEGRSVVLVEQRVEAALTNAHRGCLIGGGTMRRAGTAADVLDFVREHGLLVDTASEQAKGAGGRPDESEA